MKRFLLFIMFVAVTTIANAQLEEDFNPTPTGWVLSQGANFNSVNGNAIVNTPGVGGNNPANIGTPAVSKTSNTVKVCFDIWAYDANLNGQTPFPCATYADILFVDAAVTDSKDAEKAENIYARQDNYLLPTNGGTTCFTFTFPAAVTASSFKVFISFHAPCQQGGIKYVLDNVSISGVQLICGGANCPPVALDDVFNRVNYAETSFNGALYGSNLNYPGGNTVDATGTDNDQNDIYADLQWSVLTQPANGNVIVNNDGTFTVTRNLNTITQLTFTYRLMDNGPDNDINTTADNMFDDATVTINWPVGGSLPVSLVNFNGSRNGSYVNLQWTTNIESNNTGFEIQRSTGNGTYETVGFVPTKATGGNSSMPLYYQFKEANTAKANSWYRIVQVDKDGARTVTSARGIRGLEEISKITVYPNPGKSGNMNVLFGSSAIRDILITDLHGKIFKQLNSYRDDNMAISGLRTGVYMLIITNRVTSEKLAQKIVVL
ncbi:MAG TPA: T9SS type A sorting domain-containing protein [Niastella sp.]